MNKIKKIVIKKSRDAIHTTQIHTVLCRLNRFIPNSSHTTQIQLFFYISNPVILVGFGLNIFLDFAF